MRSPCCDAVWSGKGSSRNASLMGLLVLGHGARADWKHSFITLGLAFGGRPAASFAQRLMLPVSNDTLLRVVRRRGTPPSPAPTAIGIDDWAWRRNQRYGTIIYDLQRRGPIRLRPDMEPATAQAWPAEQPQVAIIARDRGGAYARAAATALPNAVQVADRWHLMENASHAFLDAVRRSMRQIRCAIGAMAIKPELLTAAERLQYEGYLHREETNAVMNLSVLAYNIKRRIQMFGVQPLIQMIRT